MNAIENSRQWIVDFEALVRLPEDLMQICPVGAYLCIVVVESHNLAWHHENDPVWIVAGTTGAPSCIEKFLSLENFASIQISIIPTVFCDDDKLTGKIHSLGYGRCCRQHRDAICTLIERLDKSPLLRQEQSMMNCGRVLNTILGYAQI